MTQPTDRIQQLADEIRSHKHPDSYTIGRARGYLLGDEPAETKLANIAAVFEAWALTLRVPDPASRDEADHEGGAR